MKASVLNRLLRLMPTASFTALFACNKVYGGDMIPVENETPDFVYALYFVGGLLALLLVGAAINGILSKARDYNLRLIFSWQFAIQLIGGGIFLIAYTMFSMSDEPISPSLVSSFATTFLLPAFIIAAIGNILKSNVVFGLIFTALQSLVVFFGILLVLFIKNTSSKSQPN